MGYEYKVYHKETGEEIHEENFSQYFSQYIALDSDGDLVEIDSRDAVLVSVIDFAYIKFNKTDEYEVKAKAFDAIMREWEDERLTKSHILETIQKYYNEYERSGSDEL